VNDSSLARLAAVLVAPGRTFAAIAERPTWLLAMVVFVVSAIGLGWAAHTRTDYRDVMEQAMAGRGQQLEAAQLDRMVDFQERFGAVLSVAGGVVAAGVVALVAAVFLVVLRLLGSDLTYRQSLSAYLHGAMPVVLGMLIAVPVVLGGGTLSYEALTTRNFLASNLGALAPAEAGMVLKTALASVDFFALWSLVLWAIGFRVVGRVSPAAAWGTSILVFLLGVALRVGMTALSAG
jgi:hypothetical protein